jgi:hypothetical protein
LLFLFDTKILFYIIFVDSEDFDMESGDQKIDAGVYATADGMVTIENPFMDVDGSTSAGTPVKEQAPTPLSAAMDVRYVSPLYLSNTSLNTLPMAYFTMPTSS